MKKILIGIFLIAAVFAINAENSISSNLLASNVEALAQGGAGDPFGYATDIYPNGMPGSNYDAYGNWTGNNGAGGSAGQSGGDGGGDWRPPPPFPYCVKGATFDENGVDLPACIDDQTCKRSLIKPKQINVNLCSEVLK